MKKLNESILENLTEAVDNKPVDVIVSGDLTTFKNRKEVEVGLRLGGNFDNSIGTAWFSDIKIESGVADKSDEWKMLCLIFDRTNVTLEINGTKQNFDLNLCQNYRYSSS